MADTIEFQFSPADKPITVDWPCTISVPTNGGTRQSMRLVARFVVATDEEVLTAYDGNLRYATRGRCLREFFTGKVVGEGDAAKAMPGVVVGFPELKAQGSSEIVGMRPDVMGELMKRSDVLDGLAKAYLVMLGRGDEDGRQAKN